MYKVIRLPDEVFEIDEGINIQTKSPFPATMEIGYLDKIDYREDGIFTYQKGLNQGVPVKGYLILEALEAADILKKYVKGWIWILSMSPVRYFLAPFFFLPSKVLFYIIRKWVEAYADFTFHIIKYFSIRTKLILKPKYYSRPVRELSRAFLETFGESRETDILAKAGKMTLENDRPYLLRIQDVLSEMNYEMLLVNPRKEIVRLAALFSSRDRARDWSDIPKTLSFFLFVRRDILRITAKFLYEIRTYETAFDENDLYFICQTNEYDFMGKSFEERKEMLKHMRIMEDGEVVLYDEDVQNK